MSLPDAALDETAILRQLERRLGRVHARQRLGLERAHESQIFGQGRKFFHVENWRSAAGVVRVALRLSGLLGRARRNAERVLLRRHEPRFPALPAAFDGFTILHLSDLHLDISPGAMARVGELVRGLDYDLCVLTGDFRGRTFGPCAETLAALERLAAQLRGPLYGVLGNHDSIEMVPAMEAMGIRLLLNECAVIDRGAALLHLAGIDDAHFFRVDSIAKAAQDIPERAFAILLSHTPEIYRQAAHAGFALMLAGHTHGGQICLPGGVPVTLDAKLPRRFGAGAWRYHSMLGYTSRGAGTSLLPARLNCPPEITLHILRRG